MFFTILKTERLYKTIYHIYFQMILKSSGAALLYMGKFNKAHIQVATWVALQENKPDHIKDKRRSTLILSNQKTQSSVVIVNGALQIKNLILI